MMKKSIISILIIVIVIVGFRIHYNKTSVYGQVKEIFNKTFFSSNVADYDEGIKKLDEILLNKKITKRELAYIDALYYILAAQSDIEKNPELKDRTDLMAAIKKQNNNLIEIFGFGKTGNELLFEELEPISAQSKIIYESIRLQQ